MNNLKFSEGLAPFQGLSGKWGFIDRSGKPAIKALYEDVYLFSEGLAAAIKIVNGVKCLGFINSNGDEVIPFKFDTSYFLPVFKNQIAIVLVDSVKRYINKSGEIIEELANFIPVSDFSPQGIAKVKYENKDEAIVTKAGKVISLDSDINPEEYAEGYYLANWGIFHQNYNGYYKIVNEKIVRAFNHPVFQRLTPFSDGIAAVKEQNKPTLRINKKGETVGRELTEWTIFHDINSGWLPVTTYSENLTNYIGSKSDTYLLDKHLTSHDYWLHTFYDGMSRIQLQKKFSPLRNVLGYFNTNGEKVIDKKFDSGHDFSEGFAAVELNGEIIYIDHQGKELFKFKSVIDSSGIRRVIK